MFSMFLYTVPAVVVGQFVDAIKLFCYFLLFNYCFVLFICRVFLPSLYYRISAPRTSGPAHSATSPILQNRIYCCYLGQLRLIVQHHLQNRIYCCYLGQLRLIVQHHLQNRIYCCYLGQLMQHHLQNRIYCCYRFMYYRGH